MTSIVGRAFDNKRFINVIASTNADILFRAKQSNSHYWNETLALNFNRAIMNILCSKPVMEYTVHSTF